MVFDYSPGAQLASRGYDFKRIVTGIPFACPPCGEGFPAFHGASDADLNTLQQIDARLLDAMNNALGTLSLAPFAHAGELYTQIDQMHVLGIPELDAYASDRAGNFTGVWPASICGAAPEWPKGDGPRLAGYLKSSRLLEPLLNAIPDSGLRALLYVSDMDHTKLSAFAHPSIRFSAAPLDWPATVRDADLAVLHGGLTSTCEALLAGTPTLIAPLYQEQRITAERVEQLGAGVSLELHHLDGLSTRLANWASELSVCVQAPERGLAEVVDSIDGMVKI